MSVLHSLVDQICYKDQDLVKDLRIKWSFNQQRGPYDLVEQNHDTLLVTIGDSWTYGARLGEEFPEQPEQGRLTHCFGYRLAQQLNVDWLNLAFPSTNNLWMAERYTNICEIADQLSYKKIIVFVTLTEFGREICTDFDLDPALNDRYRQTNSADGLAQTLAEYTADLFLATRHDRVDLRLGINYVTNIYPTRLQPYFVERTWLECCLGQPLEDRCIVVGTWALDKFKLLPKEFNASIDQTVFLEECLDMIDRANRRLNLIYNTGYNNQGGYGHPNTRGHQKWADYLADILANQI